MSEWVRLCAVTEAPQVDGVMEVEAAGVAVCLARVGGSLHAMDNWCPHRRGPLGQGWVEGSAVVCPWHSWAFDCTTGEVEPPDGPGRVTVFAVKEEGGDVLVRLG
jgi:nitrite reductase (NADH) small subunit